MIVYDCEIIRAISSPREPQMAGIEYCNGWHDHANMGISCIGAFDYTEQRYRIFCQDNLQEFQRLVDRADLVVGFNSVGFDNKLCAANGIIIPDEKSYDLLIAVWNAAGLGDVFTYPTHVGFGLDAICSANFGASKSGHGALAPIEWQHGNIGNVIDYCINDVRLTVRLLNYVISHGQIKDPRDPSKTLKVKRPQ